MRLALSLISGLALLLTAVAPLLFSFDQLSEAGLRNLLLIAMLGWFGTAVIRERVPAE